MVKQFKVFTLAGAVSLAAMLSGSVSLAGAAPVSTVTSATLFAETPGLLQSVTYPSSVFITPDNGWTFSYDNSAPFSAYASNGQTSYGFDLPTSSYLAALDGAHQVDIDLDLNGLGSCDSENDGVVKDFSAADGHVTRLDVVFTDWCSGTQESGYVSGEIQYNEPVDNTARSMPSELLFPPINARSTVRRTYPIELYGTSTKPTMVSTVALSGRDHKQFRITSDACSSHTITETSPCTVGVRYLPGGTRDLATLVATSNGATICRTPLDGALLPGRSYWAMNDLGTAPFNGSIVYRPDAHNEVDLEGQAVGTPELIFGLLPSTGSHAAYQSLTIQASRPLHVGDYRIANTYKPSQAASVVAASYTYSYFDEPIASGTLRIRQLDLARTERGLEHVAAVAVSVKLMLVGASRPLYLSLGYLTTAGIDLPDVSRPAQLTHLQARHAHDSTQVRWDRSTDLAVSRYVLRVRHGIHRSVGWKRGRVATSATNRITLRASGYRVPLTITAYAVDSAGHHSLGRTLVVR